MRGLAISNLLNPIYLIPLALGPYLSMTTPDPQCQMIYFVLRSDFCCSLKFITHIWDLITRFQSNYFHISLHLFILCNINGGWWHMKYFVRSAKNFAIFIRKWQKIGKKRAKNRSKSTIGTFWFPQKFRAGTHPPVQVRVRTKSTAPPRLSLSHSHI